MLVGKEKLDGVYFGTLLVILERCCLGGGHAVSTRNLLTSPRVLKAKNETEVEEQQSRESSDAGCGIACEKEVSGRLGRSNDSSDKWNSYRSDRAKSRAITLVRDHESTVA